MQPAEQQLLQRVLSSRQFEHAHILKRVLRYICEQAAADVTPKEYDIAVSAMGRQKSFDPRTDPIVRVSMAGVRERLSAYFNGEGRDEPLRLEIPKGQYRALFMRLPEPLPAPAEVPGALQKFWWPYFSGAAAGNIIVYTDPLFFSDDHGLYIRDLQVNDLAHGARPLLERAGLEGLGPLRPSYHYLSAGEVHCMLSVSRMFHERGTPLETRNSRISSWNDLGHSNLVLLGSPRTNTFIDSLQGEGDFLVTGEAVENRNPLPGEQSVYRARRYMDGKLPRMTEYAVLTRRPGPTPGAAITMIAANHGRAIEGAGRLLTLENEVRSLLEAMGLGTSDTLPSGFQALLRVETIDCDDEVVHVEAAACRITAE
ncbi:MAG TPA: hypothetical protein VN442_03645 [Bryobacteraceae bacterium]|nr:hypothetical protein [Bryobacteraceae bacterium]